MDNSIPSHYKEPYNGLKDNRKDLDTVYVTLHIAIMADLTCGQNILRPNTNYVLNDHIKSP